VLERSQHLLRHKLIQQPDVHCAAGSLIEGTVRADVHYVIVAMPVGVVALAVKVPVLLLAQPIGMQPV
jgi:hypothetical protein